MIKNFALTDEIGHDTQIKKEEVEKLNLSEFIVKALKEKVTPMKRGDLFDEIKSLGSTATKGSFGVALSILVNK